MKKLVIILGIGLFSYACSSNNNQQQQDSAAVSSTTKQTETGTGNYDPKRGEGKFTNVALGEALDSKMAEQGHTIANLKCASCHKYTDEKLVGPGWAGVSKKHSPEWIMNFITNPDAMIDKDPELQAQLEICLVRMPNQNLSDEDARNILEFMRKNDGVK